MKTKLRHPVRAIREPFGTAGLIVACLALVLALTGAAFAAGKLTAKEKKEVEKIAKKFAGKPGAGGAQGPTGPMGPAGPQGPAGPEGKLGPTGAQGSSGANGKSVTTGTATPAECEEGGITVEVEGTPSSKKKVCNGEVGSAGSAGPEGPTGPEGKPWTAGGTLPMGSTETGMWELRSTANAAQEVRIASVSFPIPLASPPAPVYVLPGQTLEGCEGDVANPTAAPGFLCVYEGESPFGLHKGGLNQVTMINPDASGPSEGVGPLRMGAEVVFFTAEPGTPGEEVSAEGTWAVTG